MKVGGGGGRQSLRPWMIYSAEKGIKEIENKPMETTNVGPRNKMGCF